MKAGLMLAGAAAGLGSGISSLASRYIDAEMAQQKAEALAALQVKTAQTIREQDDAFANDPARVARNRENKRQDVLAAGAAARESELAGLSDTALQDARRGQKDRDAADDTRRKIDARKQELTELAPAETAAAVARKRAEGEAAADLTKQYGNDPIYLQALRRQKQAEHVESAASSAQAELTRMKIEDEKRLGRLYDDLLALDEKNLPAQEKQQRMRTLQSQIAAIKAKNGGAAEKGATEEVESEYDAENKLVSRKVKTKGPAGSGPAAPADPATQLRAGVERARKDGKIGDAIAELRKAGASPAQLLQAGITEDELRGASQPDGRATPSRQPSPPVEPAPDSIVAKHRARAAAQAAEREQSQAAKQQQAAQAFAAIGNDRAAAAKLQASELFGLLTQDQQRAIYNLVNGVR